MSGILHSTQQFTTKPSSGYVKLWTPLKCKADELIYDSHFVAALVFFDATVERTVNIKYSLSQSNPVTASNSYHFDMDLITDSFPIMVIDIAFGVHSHDTTTVAFFEKNHFKKYRRSKSRIDAVADLKSNSSQSPGY